jgi:cysteine synthase A
VKRKYQSIVEAVGKTPVVRINRLAQSGVNLFVKIEAFNPLGRSRHGLRSQGIPACGHHGRTI